MDTNQHFLPRRLGLEGGPIIADTGTHSRSSCALEKPGARESPFKGVWTILVGNLDKYAILTCNVWGLALEAFKALKS